VLVVDRRLDDLRAALRAQGGRLYLGGGAGGGPAFAPPQQALLVIGPPRAGKTTGLVVPNVLAAPGAVISTSTKPDVLAATLPGRAGMGPCWLFDPSGTVTAPPGVGTIRWSPVCASRTWDDALLTSRAIVGAARPGGRWGEAAHWTERAEALLAPLLHAAALDGADMRAVLGWVLRQQSTPAEGVLSRQGASVGADVLRGIAATDAREQSGIWSTAAGALAAYRSDAALAATADPNFDPTTLAATGGTVYICAPARDQQLVAPLVVAFIEQARAGAYAANRHGRAAAPLVLALDEVTNIAPLPDLPAMVSEGGSQGLLTLACVQDLSQARQRWGPAADGFLSLFGAKVILPGVADLTTLDLVSRLGGEIDVPTRSLSQGSRWSRSRRSPTTTWSTHRQRRLPVDAVNQLPTGTALLLEGRHPPARVTLTPWWTTAPFAPVAEPVTPARRLSRRTGHGIGR
jgi:type IV secretory pathway TraG/TraD family ATPase VirD4